VVVGEETRCERAPFSPSWRPRKRAPRPGAAASTGTGADCDLRMAHATSSLQLPQHLSRFEARELGSWRWYSSQMNVSQQHQCLKLPLDVEGGTCWSLYLLLESDLQRFRAENGQLGGSLGGSGIQQGCSFRVGGGAGSWARSG